MNVLKTIELYTLKGKFYGKWIILQWIFEKKKKYS